MRKCGEIKLLKDNKGTYGISLFHKRRDGHDSRLSLMFREDKIQELGGDECSAQLFQKIPFKNKQIGWAYRSSEWSMVIGLTDLLLDRAGKGECVNIKSLSQSAKAEYLRYFHAARSRAVYMINGLIDQALTSIPEHKIRILRQHAVAPRSVLYHNLCKTDSERPWQLMETFPLLGYLIYGVELNNLYQNPVDSVRKAVLRGEKLSKLVNIFNDVMESGNGIEFPTIFLAHRKIKPGNVRHVSNASLRFFERNPKALQFLPESVPKARSWLWSVGYAFESEARGDDDFACWVAKKADYWHYKRLPQQIRLIEDYRRFNSEGLVKPFNVKMSPQVAERLMDEWHEERVKVEAEKVTFPKPWLPAKEGEVRIKPIRNHIELSKMARIFHNCSAGYARDIAEGHNYLYVIEEKEKPLAMLSLVRQDDKVMLGEISGFCNQEVKPSVESVAKRWVQKHKKLASSLDFQVIASQGRYETMPPQCENPPF